MKIKELYAWANVLGVSLFTETVYLNHDDVYFMLQNLHIHHADELRYFYVI